MSAEWKELPGGGADTERKGIVRGAGNRIGKSGESLTNLVG